MRSSHHIRYMSCPRHDPCEIYCGRVCNSLPREPQHRVECTSVCGALHWRQHWCSIRVSEIRVNHNSDCGRMAGGIVNDIDSCIALLMGHGIGTCKERECCEGFPTSVSITKRSLGGNALWPVCARPYLVWASHEWNTFLTTVELRR